MQHLKIGDSDAIGLCELAFVGHQPAQRLFALSPAGYRYRWNKLLACLAIDKTLRLTPGGLRGGGAVYCYRVGTAVSEIQWRMRLKNQATLGFYLQEVGAITALGGLSEVARRKTKAASAFYPFLRFSK